MQTEDWHFEHYTLRIYRAGQGPTLLLLHGIGPGTSIPANFSAVTDALGEHYSLVGVDLIGMGNSSKKTEAPYFDFALWCRQAAFVAQRLCDESGEQALRVWGHSLGGAIALQLAATSKRVSHVVASGTGGGNHRVNPALDFFWTFPTSPAALKQAMMSSMYDPAGVTDELVAGRFATLQQGDVGPYFSQMMSGDKQALLDSVRLAPEQLAGIEASVLLIHGRDDRPCPYEDNVGYLMRHIAKCDVSVFGQCGHNPGREYPQKTVGQVLAHFA